MTANEHFDRIDKRFDRLERASAELLTLIKGNWSGPASSAVGTIVAEQRVAERERVEREDLIRREEAARAEAEVDRRLAESSI